MTSASKKDLPLELKVFVCDLGFSAAKWQFDEREGRFFSASAIIRGKKVYGDEAMFSTTPSYLLSCEDLVDHYSEMCLAAVAESGYEGDRAELHMVVGVPLEYFEAEQERQGCGNLSLIKNNLIEAGFGDATILPQGLGGVVLFCNKHPEHSGNILGLDIGFSTIIMSLYSPKLKKIIFSSTKYNHGVTRLGKDYLVPKISSLVPSRNLAPPSLCMIMERGVIQYDINNKYDVTPQLTEAVSEYVETTLKEVSSQLRAGVGDAMTFDTVLFFGGGARHIKDRIDAGGSSIKFVVMEQPEMANARGFKLIAESGRV